MNSIKPRKACVHCYQKKVRCNWSEAAPVCSYCASHGLQCLLPDPTQPAQRTAVKDKLAEFEARLRKLEDESKNPNKSSAQSVLDLQKASVHVPNTSGPSHSLSSPSWSSLEGHAESELPTGSNDRRRQSSLLPVAEEEDHFVQEEAPDLSNSTAVLEPRQTTLPPSSTWDVEDAGLSSSSRSSVRRFRGETSPWNMLADGTAAVSTALDNGPFNDTIARLAEEDSSTRPTANFVQYDLLMELPPLNAEQILEFARNYASEAPFPVVCWPTLKRAIQKGLGTRRWNHWGEIVCVLLYIAFGSAHLRVSIPGYDSEVYFQKAWNMLPQILLEQDLWALKGLTLMVHYLQGGSLPEPCYTLLGSASRMAISLGFHRKYYDKYYSPTEEEEGKRCFWLCYVLEKTFSLVLGRPGTNLDAFSAEHPRPFTGLNNWVSTSTMRTSHVEKQNDQNDDEAVALFHDLIEVLHARDDFLRKPDNQDLRDSTQIQAKKKDESMAEVISTWRSSSKLHRPLDFDTSTPASLRATICDLCYYNSIICIDRHLKQDFEISMSRESIEAARATIRLVAESGSNGLTMCLWMWLYYSFSSAVVLFLDVIHNPLHPEATLNLALISDLEILCMGLSSFSPGANRVMDITREMNKVAFDFIKAKSKRKAQGEPDLGTQGRLKQRRTKNVPSSSTDNRAANMDPSPGSDAIQNTSHTWDEEFSWSNFPANFSWDDWEQWLNYTSG